MNQVECALSCFQEGFSCAQAVLSAYGPQYGLDRELALKVAGAFGGGMGHMGQVCGAVTGAFMVIGLKYGKTCAEDNETREKASVWSRSSPSASSPATAPLFAGN